MGPDVIVLPEPYSGYATASIAILVLIRQVFFEEINLASPHITYIGWISQAMTFSQITEEYYVFVLAMKRGKHFL